MLKRQLERQEFNWVPVRVPWKASLEDLTLEFGVTVPFLPSPRLEVDVFKLGGELFNATVDDFAIKSAPRR